MKMSKKWFLVRSSDNEPYDDFVVVQKETPEKAANWFADEIVDLNSVDIIYVTEPCTGKTRTFSVSIKHIITEET
jgi:hypothetical protein